MDIRVIVEADKHLSVWATLLRTTQTVGPACPNRSTQGKGRHVGAITQGEGSHVGA